MEKIHFMAINRQKIGCEKASNFYDVLISIARSGVVPEELQTRIFSLYELGEVSESPDDGFLLHEITETIAFEQRMLDVRVKTYFIDGRYAGNAIAFLSPIRVTTIVRSMLALLSSGKLRFSTLEVYCDSDFADGALIFDRRLVVKFSRGRARRANNYYADILESDQSEVGEIVSDWSSVAMVETVLKRRESINLASGNVPIAMKKLERQLDQFWTKGPSDHASKKKGSSRNRVGDSGAQ